MPDVYNLPEAYELKLIEPELVQALTKDDPLLDETKGLCKLDTIESFRLLYEQEDSLTGLQQVRGLNGEPAKVDSLGGNQFEMEPGVYGEYMVIDEVNMTLPRQYGTLNDLEPLDQQIGKKQLHLLIRRLNRIRLIIWTLFVTGVLYVQRKDGKILHSDAFPIRQYSAQVPWSDHANSTPFADIRALKLLSLGTSTSLGAGAVLFLNAVQVNHLLSNVNPADLGRYRGPGGASVIDLTDVNKLLKNEDLPQIVPYEGCYLEEGTGNPIRYLPTGRGVLVGVRTTGAPVAEFLFTKNANNVEAELSGEGEEGQSGPYTKVIDLRAITVPPKVEVHDGFNGGLVVYFPKAIVSLIC